MRSHCTAIALGLAIAPMAAADVFLDATGDMYDPALSNLDIKSVTVTNDATHLYFDILLDGNLDATNWGKYGVAIDSAAGGANSNGWGRSIDWGRDIDSWIGTWADDGGSGVGGQIWTYSSGWSVTGSVIGDDSGHADGHQRFSIALADLGLSIGDTFAFDVISTGSGGSDPGIDHLSRSDAPTTAFGGTSYAGTFRNYTVESIAVVPGIGGLAALGGLGLIGRRRGR